MVKFSKHHASKYVKILYIGDSGTGKTGSLVSLVKAGYKLKILDLDNGLDALFQFTHRECADNIDNIDYETRRDAIIPGKMGPIIQSNIYVEATKLMTEWSDGTQPCEGGENEVFVIDSLTALGNSALEWARRQNPTAKDKRQWFFTAQLSIEHIIGMLTSEAFHANVIVITHINYKELQEGKEKGYPNAVGSALGPKIPKYFNTMVQAQVEGFGKTMRRTISTVPTEILDLKNPTPFRIEENYPLGDGLAELFKKLKTTN